MSKGEKNFLKDKSLTFAIRIVNLYKYLSVKKKEKILSKQILRSGTCVGVMIREAEFEQSKQDFVHKLSIAQKEINETIYWLELLKETNFLTEVQFKSICSEALELLKLITSSIKTAKRNLSLITKH